MADALQDPPFFLPPHFLSDHDNLDLPLNFPTEFPYEFESTDSSDEDDFLNSLTQRLTQSTIRESQNLAVNKSEAKVAMAGSPQSTLSGFGSLSGWSTVSSDGSPNGPSQAPSPPTTPFGGDNNTWDLIYAAAGQVARLKMSGDGLIGSRQSSNLVSSMKNPRDGLYSQFQTQDSMLKPQPEWSFAWGRQVKVAEPQNHQIQRRGGDFCHDNGRFGRLQDLPQSGGPSLQVQRRSDLPQPRVPAMSLHGGGSAPKRECAGTGVFLPRRFDNPPQSRRRTGKAVQIQARNSSFEDLNRSAVEPNRRLPPSYDVIIARRNAMFAQQRLNHQRQTEVARSHELLLPQEWTY